MKTNLRIPTNRNTNLPVGGTNYACPRVRAGGRMIRMATNKRRMFTLFAMVVFFVAGVTMFASPVFAIPCYDDQGAYVGDYATCPTGSSNLEGSGGGTISTFAGLLNHINGILNITIPFIIGLAVFVIIFGVFRYIFHAADEEKRKEARLFITWGVVGVFIMLSIWGLVRILANTLPLTKAPVQVGSIFPTKK